MHRELAEAACVAQHLPQSFCHRMGKQVYEVDYLEWTDLSAHAQREPGQPRCEAADAAESRVDQLARSLVSQVNAGKLEAAAISLGRALHTIQDECAHHGMTNPEHAFYSLTEQCSGNAVSPDVQPAALACARTRTTAVLKLAAAAISTQVWRGAYDLCTDYSNEHQTDSCANAALPSPFMACDFLSEHDEWDGHDTTWDPTAVGDALVASFAAGLTGEQTTRSVCGGDSSAIDPPRPRATVTALGGLGCLSTTLGCFGKVDEGGTGTDEATGGCSTSSPGGLAAIALVGALALAPRRRRRR